MLFVTCFGVNSGVPSRDSMAGSWPPLLFLQCKISYLPGLVKQIKPIGLLKISINPY